MSINHISVDMKHMQEQTQFYRTLYNELAEDNRFEQCLHYHL